MKKITFLSIAAFLAVTSFTGCAVKNPYIAPSSGDTAKLRIVNHSSGTTFVHTTTSCDRPSAKALAVFSSFLASDTSRVGMYGDQAYEGNSSVVERILEAGKESQFFIANQGANGLNILSCFIDTAFIPQKDEQYEMHFVSAQGICNLSLMKLSEVDGKILKEKVDSFRKLKKDECK